MIVLLVLVIIIALNLFLDEENYKKYGIYISFFLIFFIFSFRNQVGIDDKNYIYYYELISEGQISKFFAISAVEDSFYYIAKPLTFLGFNYKMLFFVYAFISCFFLYKIIEKFNFDKNKYLIFFISFLAFCILPYVTIMRQFAASMVGIYACLLFNDNKYFESILILLFSIFLHNSAFVFIFVFLLLKIKWFNKKILYISLPILAWILNITGIFFSMMKFLLKATPYYRHFLDIGNDSFGGSSIVVIFMFVLYCISIYVMSKKYFENKDTRIILIFEMIFFSLYFVTQNMGVLGRLYDYFIMFQPFALIWIFQCAKNKKAFLYGIVSFLCLLVFYNFAIKNFERFHINEYSINVIGGVKE